MAIATLRPPFSRISGKITSAGTAAALIVSTSITTACTIRQHCETVKPATAAQRACRTKTGLSAKAFHNLTKAQADAWRAAAAEINRLNALGTRYTFTGINLFQQVNFLRQLNDEAITVTPPSLNNLPTPATGFQSTNYTAGTNTLTIIVNSGSSVNYSSRALLRITSSSANQARLHLPNECRIPTTDTSLSFAWNVNHKFSFTIHPDTVNMAINQYAGVQITIMSADYLPREPWFTPLLKIGF